MVRDIVGVPFMGYTFNIVNKLRTYKGVVKPASFVFPYFPGVRFIIGVIESIGVN